MADEKKISASFTEILYLDFDVANADNIFAFYVGALFLLAYFLSIFVATLHQRQDSLVYPLTRPQAGMYFCEYIIMLKTSLRFGSTFDYRGRLLVELIGSFSDSIPLHLKKGKGIELFLERGATNIYVYHSPCDLGDIQEVKITMVNDAPHEIPFVDWQPAYISVMQPATGKWWACTPNKKFRCSDMLIETLQCTPKLRNRYSILKAVCMFHSWISMFNCPVRFGMYSNFVNAVVVFFVATGILTTILLVELSFNIQRLSNASPELTDVAFLRYLIAAGVVWVVEVLVEAFLRNTVPKFSATRYSQFHGLMEPVQSIYGLRDFSIGYDWERIRPLIPDRKVIIPYGYMHGNAQSVFTIVSNNSYFNMWGMLGLEEERAGNWFDRILNICALPLPAALKWLSKEATGRKEDVIMQQFDESYESPMCFFDCWLIDWPLHYIDEPQQAGLIMTHIIMKDILTLSKMHSKAQRARVAQVCVHQWHGMICCVLPHVIKQSFEYRGVPVSGLRTFIYNTSSRFGKRTAREIQGTWKARQKRLKQIQVRRGANLGAEDVKDENVSAQSAALKGPLSVARSIWSSIKPVFNEKDMEPDIFGMNSDALLFDWRDVDDYNVDLLIFDELIPPEKETKSGPVLAGSGCGDVTGMGDSFRKSPPKQMPKYTVVQEGHAERRSGSQQTSEEMAGSRRRKIPSVTQKCSPNEMEMGDVSHDSVQIDMNTNTSASADDCNVNTNTTEAIDQLEPETESVDAVTDFDLSRCPCTGSADMPHTNKVVSSLGDMTTNAEISDQRPFDKNTNARESESIEEHLDILLKKKLEKKKELAASKKEAINRRRSRQLEALDGEEAERKSMPIAGFENHSLGPPFNENVARERDPANPWASLRHRDEILGYCCSSKRCQANADLHKRMGSASLEILKKVLLDLMNFAVMSKSVASRSKLWLRKKVVLHMFESMERKAEFFDHNIFQGNKEPDYPGFACNQLLTSILVILEIIVDLSHEIKETSLKKAQADRWKYFGYRYKPVKRCLFCAGRLKNQQNPADAGCDKLEKLVKLFSKDAVSVAEREINIELRHKVTLQRYCGMLMNLAKREVLIELEDPPSVLAIKVTRAMLCKLLEEMVPRHTDFKDMTADELRRVGTRRERILARHDPTAAGNKKETGAEKRRKEMITTISEELSNRWRLNVKENELNYCAKLLGQILVHERIMGFSVYSGFITKEHEQILDSSRAHLGEVEKKAYETVLKVARHVIQPRLNKVLNASRHLDVMFSRPRLETMYVLEAVCVAQVQLEPVVLKTCCYYIRNIVNLKVEEFQELMNYVINMKPARDLKGIPKLTKMAVKYDVDGKIHTQTVKNHAAISSPILRWGPVVIKGIPPLPENLQKAMAPNPDFNDICQKAIETGNEDKDLEQLVTNLLKTRSKVNTFLASYNMDKSKQLQHHLARVQARLTEQIALVSQSISDAHVLDRDFLREYHRDELFNVEFYATGNLKAPFGTGLGVVLILFLVLLTLGMVFFTTLKASSLNISEVKIWFVAYTFCMLIYGFVLEILKCIMYSILGVYVH